MRSLIQRYPFSTFAILSFGWTWPMAALSSRFLVFPLAGLFGPALAAVVVLSVTEGRAGLSSLLSRFRVRRVDLPWLAVAILLPLALLVLVWLLWFWKTQDPAFELGPMTPLSLLLALLIVGEEVGWRGFGLPCLLRRWPALAAGLGLGAVWAVWHLPNFLLPGFPHHGLPFTPFLILVVSHSILFTWLYLRTAGSLTVAVVFHAALNLFSLANVDPISDYWLRAGVYSAVAGIVAAAGGLRDFPAVVVR
jgi:uncharacterized protein